MLYGMQWAHVDRVFGIGHVRGNHWVAYEAKLMEQCIVVYDSMSEHPLRDIVIQSFQQVARAIPAMCATAKVWTRKGWDEGQLKESWEIMYDDNTPQQTNGYDCGIMAVKFIECLATGNSMQLIEPDRCGMYRKIYCSELFKSRMPPTPR